MHFRVCRRAASYTPSYIMPGAATQHQARARIHTRYTHTHTHTHARTHARTHIHTRRLATAGGPPSLRTQTAHTARRGAAAPLCWYARRRPAAPAAYDGPPAALRAERRTAGFTEALGIRTHVQVVRG